MSPEQRRARGIASRILIDDPNVREAFEAIEADIMTEWGRSDWVATVWPFRRHRLWHDLQAVRRLRQTLASFAAQSGE